MNWPAHGGQPHDIQIKMRELIQAGPSSSTATNDDKQEQISLQQKQVGRQLEQKHVLDFSANLNPLGPPKWLKNKLGQCTDTITTYPDPAYEAPRKALAIYNQVEPNEVVLTNGGAEAIFLIAKCFEGKRALIIHPTFSEYEQACRHYHLHVDELFLLSQAQFSFPLDNVMMAMEETDVVFICRPNNPTGTMVSINDMLKLLQKGVQTNTTIVVDEAFVDFLPGGVHELPSLIRFYPNLILLRSLTKLYTIPGLRGGYIIAHEDICAQCRSYQLPWSVNAIASSLVPLLIQDEQFVQETHKWLDEELAFVKEGIASLNYYMSPTHVNFYLLQPPNREETYDLFQYLVNEHIIPRHTYNFKGLDGQFLRFAVRSRTENEQLLTKLKRWREIR